MAEPGPIPPPEAELEHPGASAEVRSKLTPRKNPEGTPRRVSQVDNKLDRQPVFLVMTSGQIESAEVACF